MTSVIIYEDWKMRQPKGKPQGFTTALRVCVMVSTNCTWKGREAAGEDRPVVGALEVYT